MATTTTTGIELENVNHNVTQRDISSSSANEEADDIILASRLADATVPEGGYGWVVVFGCATIAWWAVGTSYCWGVIQNALIQEGLSSAATLSFVGSLATAFIAAFAIINSRLTRLLGVRYTGVLGVTLLGLSELLSSFSTRNVGGLFVTAGALMGFGISLSFTTISITPAQYFSKKRGLANGIVFAGGGLGGAVISFVIDELIHHLGIAWTYRVLGLMTLATGVPAAWLVKERIPIKPTRFIDWRLFRDFRFTVIFLAGAVGTFPLFVSPFFLPLYSHSIGLSSSTGASLVAGFNFSSAIGRIVSGFLCDRFGSLNTLFLAFTLSALSMLILWPISTTLAPMIVFVMVNGASNGGFFATMPTVVGNLFGSARLSVAMGMVVTGWGGGYLMGAPIAGYLLEAYGGAEQGFQAYRPAIFYAGSMALGSAGLVLLVRLKSSMKLLVKL